MQRGFRRAVGLIVVGAVLGAIALLWWAVDVTESPELWAPVEATLGGIWRVLYVAALPPLSVLATALAVAILLVALVVGTERLVTRRYRRTPPDNLRRTLAPRRIMERTRGVFAGEMTVTVLIPAHNEEASLPETLDSLKRQVVLPQRVIVIADNCTDRTVEVARAHGAEVFETFGNTHKKAGGLNQALRGLLPDLGDNDAVLVMDADTILSPRFLEVAVERMRRDRALMGVGGLFAGEEGHGLLGQFQRNEYTRYRREIRRRDGRVFVLTGTGTLFRSAALRVVAAARGHSLPGTHGEVYDTAALTEDNELTIAIKSLGGLMTSPEECSVVTELMPTWRLLWAQRLRWQRGALENLGAYGVTPQTVRYWGQQVAIGYGAFALFAYFASLIIMLLAIETWVWFPFWIGLGIIFIAERVVTVWQGGPKARVLAAFIFPELVYDAFLNLAFLWGVIEIFVGKGATWRHVDHEPAGRHRDDAYHDDAHPDDARGDELTRADETAQRDGGVHA